MISGRPANICSVVNRVRLDFRQRGKAYGYRADRGIKREAASRTIEREAWRRHYIRAGPHSALGNQSQKVPCIQVQGVPDRIKPKKRALRLVWDWGQARGMWRVGCGRTDRKPQIENCKLRIQRRGPQLACGREGCVVASIERCGRAFQRSWKPCAGCERLGSGG